MGGGSVCRGKGGGSGGTHCEKKGRKKRGKTEAGLT